MHFWPSSINRKYSQMRRQPKISSKTKTFSFSRSKPCKSVHSGLQNFVWMTINGFNRYTAVFTTILLKYSPSTAGMNAACLPWNLVTGADAPTRPANLLPTTLLCVNKGAGRFKRDTTWRARFKISKTTANTAKSIESKTHMWGKPGRAANKSRRVPHGEGSSGRTWSTSNNGQGQPIHPSCFLLFHQAARRFRYRKSQGPHCGKEACRRVVDALCGDAELALRPGQRLWNSSLPTYGHNAGRE